MIVASALAAVAAAPVHGAVATSRLGVSLIVVATCGASARAVADARAMRPRVQVDCAGKTPTSVSVARERIHGALPADVVTVTY
jgi:hypothetical protein